MQHNIEKEKKQTAQHEMKSEDPMPDQNKIPRKKSADNSSDDSYKKYVRKREDKKLFMEMAK